MAHNGKKVQVNSWGFQSGAYPFINAVLEGQNWAYADGSGVVNPAEMDSDGWPAGAISGNGWLSRTHIPTQARRPGNYVVLFENGAVSGDWSIVSVGTGVSVAGVQLSVSSGTSGRAVVTPNSEWLDFYIRSSTGTGLKKFVIMHVDDEADYNAGKVFQSKFKGDYVRHMHSHRGMDWFCTNSSVVTKWKYRKPSTYWSFAADHFPPDCSQTAISNSGGDYSVTVPSWTLAHGEIAIIKINAVYAATNATGPRLQINGGAFKPLKTIQGYDWGSDYFGKPGDASGNTDLQASYWGTVVYDGDHDAYLFSNPFSSDVGIRNGIAPETYVALFQEMQADYGASPHAWFNIPVAAGVTTGLLPTVSDYPAALATYAQANLPSGIVAIYELANEPWNPNGGFYAYHFANNKERILKSTTNDGANWLGRCCYPIGMAISDVYGELPTAAVSYDFIVGMQTVAGPDADQNLHVVESPSYVADGGTAAYNGLTGICIAQYFNSEYYDTAQEQTWADAWALGDTSGIAPYIAACKTSGSRNDTIAALSGTAYPSFATKISGDANWSHLKLYGYEGGFSPDFYDNLVSDLSKFRDACKRDPAIRAMEVDNMLAFEAAGGVASSQYDLAGGPTGGIWSLMDDTWDDTSLSPRWEAVLYRNSHHRLTFTVS